MGMAVTGEQMCKVIAARFKDEWGVEREPETIWRASPNGELWPIFVMFDEAKDYFEQKGIDVAAIAMRDGGEAP